MADQFTMEGIPMLLKARHLPILLPLAVLVGCAASPGASTGVGAARQVPYSPFADMTGVVAKKIANPAELGATINTLGGAQKKFETDADFNHRMSSLKPFEVCRGVTEASLKFDSATGVARYKNWLSDAQIGGYRDKNGETFTDHNLYMPDFDVSFSSKKTGEYTGQNAFGATALVETRMVENVHLVFDPIYKGPLTYPAPYVEADAAGVIAKGKEAFLCVTAIPVAPFYRESTLHAAPTVTNPYEGQITHRFFRVKIGAIRFADSKGNTLPGEVSIRPGV